MTIDVGNASCASITIGGGSGTAPSKLTFVAGSKLTLATPGTLNVNGGLANSNFGIVDMSLGGTLTATQINANAGAQFVSGNGTIVITGNNTLPSDSSFSTFNNLNIAAGAPILGQNTTITGALQLGQPPANSGILNINGKNLTLSSLSILGGNANSITNGGGNASLTFNIPTSSVTLGVPVSGNINLVKDGLGTLIVSGNSNTYSGNTQVLNGTLQLGANNCLPNLSAVTLGNSVGPSSGILDVHGFSQTLSSVTTVLNSAAGNTVTNSSGQGQLTLKTASTYDGAITGSGLTLNLDAAGTFTLSGGANNTFTGNINLLQGQLNLGADNSLSQNSVLTLGNGSSITILDLNGKNQVLAGLNTAAGSNCTINNSGAAATLTIGSPSLPNTNASFTGQIMGNLALAINQGATLTYTGTPGYLGTTQVLNGTLRIGQPAPVLFGSAVILGNVNNSGTLDLNGGNLTLASLATSGNGTNNIVRDTGGGHTLTLNQSINTAFTGQCQPTLIMNGSGGAILTMGPNSVSNLQVLSGTVNCSGANVFTSGASSLVMGTSGIFDLSGFGQNVGTISSANAGSGTITSTSSAILNIGNPTPGSQFSYTGQVSGMLTVNISTPSSSPFTFKGGSYFGTTTINSGKVIMPVGSNFIGGITLNGSAGGPLTGNGNAGPLTVNTGGIVVPGDDVTTTTGTISCSSADFSNGGILKIKVPSNSQHDTLTSLGQVKLGGTSQLALDLTGYQPTFPISTFSIASGMISGTFSSVQIANNTTGYAVQVDYSGSDVTVTVGAVPMITTALLPDATSGINYNFNLAATNSPSGYSVSGLPQGLSFNGSGQISGTPAVAGPCTLTISASNKAGPGPSVMLGLNVLAGSVNKLQILLPGESNAPGTPLGKNGTQTNLTAGLAFNVVVKAVDINWNVVSSVTDTVSLTSNDATAVLPPNTPLSSGTVTLSVTLKAARPTNLTVTDISSGSVLPQTAQNIPVSPAPFAQLQLILPGESAAPGTVNGKTGTPAAQKATVAFPVQVNAVDPFWNVVSTVTDTVSFSSTDTRAVLPVNTPLNNGTGVFNVTLNLGPTQTITVTDATNGLIAAYTTANITVQPGNFVRMQILAPGESNAPGTPSGKTGTPASQIGGTSFQVTVNAVDTNFTIVPTSDLVRLTSSDPACTLPPDTALVNGTVMLPVTLTTGPAQTVTATDVGTLNIFPGTSASIPVATITSTLTSVSPSSGVRNGAAFTITVTGTNFLPDSVVQWNGSTRATTFVSSTQLTATIPASDLSNEGRMNVTVFSPPPGTGATAPQTFFVYSGSAVGTWVVRNTNDSGQGSLRLAMDSCTNGDLITFDPTVFDLTNSNAATFINLLSALPNMDKGSVTIDATYQRVTINGSGAGSSSGLVISSSNNTVTGLSIIGFSRSGISLEGGAQNNTIGGSRTIGNNASGTPPGPNGQGLRISGNGTFGVTISDATTSGNVVKGCWIGLDISGTQASPNLAGILLQTGAHDNTLGGTGDGEQNVISGNAAEGITVSGIGSDNNTVVANVIGIAALASTGTVTSRDTGEDIFSRSSVANGSSGIFLSRGTQNTAVGQTSSDDASSTTKSNVVGYNGGSGIEVRASTSKRNSSRGNRISHNGKKAIALFDGSNGGITAPNFTSVSIIGGRSGSADTRATTTVRVVGSATNSDGSAGSGTIEVFSDSSDQGASILGRSSVIAGVFDMQVSASDLSLNLTATYTDENGNTSPYAVYGALNSNGGGASDPTTTALDTLLGIDPTNPSDVPTGTGTVSVGKFMAGLNFAKSGHDSIQATFAVQLPDGFTAPSATVGAVFDSNSAKVTLDSKGKAPAGSTSVKITQSKTSSLAVVTFTIRNGDLLSGFASSGLTNETTTAKTGEQDTIPVGLALMTASGAKYIYTGTVTVTYTATQGRTGKGIKK